jgi:hypothetical protein
MKQRRVQWHQRFGGILLKNGHPQRIILNYYAEPPVSHSPDTTAVRLCVGALVCALVAWLGIAAVATGLLAEGGTSAIQVISLCAGVLGVVLIIGAFLSRPIWWLTWTVAGFLASYWLVQATRMIIWIVTLIWNTDFLAFPW